MALQRRGKERSAKKYYKCKKNASKTIRRKATSSPKMAKVMKVMKCMKVLKAMKAMKTTKAKAMQAAKLSKSMKLCMKTGTSKGSKLPGNKQGRSRRGSKVASTKKALAARVDAYQKGYRYGVERGCLQESVRQAAAKAKSNQLQKTKGSKRTKEREKHLATTRLQSYLAGRKYGARRERAKQTRSAPPVQVEAAPKMRRRQVQGQVSQPPTDLTSSRVPATGMRAGGTQAPTKRQTTYSKQRSSSGLKDMVTTGTGAPTKRPKESAKQKTSSGIKDAVTMKEGPRENMVQESEVSIAWNEVAPSQARCTARKAHAAGGLKLISSSRCSCPKHADLPPSVALKAAHLQSPKPSILCDASSLAKHIPSPAAEHQAALLAAPTPFRTRVMPPRQMPGSSHNKQHEDRDGMSSALEPLVPTKDKDNALRAQSGSVESLRSFLDDGKTMTADAAAFQLRFRQVHHNDGRVLAKKETVIVVDGKCKLWKLNQIISECFNAGNGKFVRDPRKGASVSGSHFLASRPLHPGKCNNTIIRPRDFPSDKASQFIDDRRYTVAHLFRGRSTRYSLQRDPADAAQSVVFVSPLLNANVMVTLDGIMLEKYDNRNPFDKQRRHANGNRPLPRIVRSSFLSDMEMEAKNFLMQGYCEGSVVKFDTSYPAIHNHYRLAQRKPLFAKGGRDFDLNDPLHAADQEVSDNDCDSDEVSSGIAFS